MKRKMQDVEYENMKGAPIANPGTSRTAYEAKGYPECVIKAVNNGIPMTNFIEWMIWAGIKNTKFREHFAKCYSISETGNYLAMEKLKPLLDTDKETLKAMDLPVWLKDRKPSNFGKAEDGTIKCLDYGLIDFDTLLNQDLFAGYDPFA